MSEIYFTFICKYMKWHPPLLQPSSKIIFWPKNTSLFTISFTYNHDATTEWSCFFKQVVYQLLSFLYLKSAWTSSFLEHFNFRYWQMRWNKSKIQCVGKCHVSIKINNEMGKFVNMILSSLEMAGCFNS